MKNLTKIIKQTHNMKTGELLSESVPGSALADGSVTKEKLTALLIHIGSVTHYTSSPDLDGAFVIFTSPSQANSRTTIPHTLGRIPTGYIIVGIDKDSSVFVDDSTSIPWTSTHITVHTKAGSTTVKMLVF